MITINNIFDENIFSEKSRILWKNFKRNQHSLKLTYLYLRVIHKEKTDNDFEKEFKTCIREISYRSGISNSQIKKHIKALIVLKLVERRIERTITKEENNYDYESEAFYKIKPLNDDNLKIAMDNEVYANTEYQIREYKKKFYKPYYKY